MRSSPSRPFSLAPASGQAREKVAARKNERSSVTSYIHGTISNKSLSGVAGGGGASRLVGLRLGEGTGGPVFSSLRGCSAPRRRVDRRVLSSLEQTGKRRSSRSVYGLFDRVTSRGRFAGWRGESLTGPRSCRELAEPLVIGSWAGGRGLLAGARDRIGTGRCRPSSTARSGAVYGATLLSSSRW